MAKFNRGLSPRFIAKLQAEAVKREGWWADVLADPRLVIGVRQEYLDVYWRGQCLFHIEAPPSNLKITTHPKYLVDPALAAPVSLSDSKFDVSSLSDNGFIAEYEGPSTLSKMKASAGIFCGREKTGCHEIAIRNRAVIDWEIAFPGTITLGNREVINTPRIDLASLEAVGSTGARLIFWEAKHFTNGELRAAKNHIPRVCYQVDGYQTCLAAHRNDIETSYRRVIENLLAIDRMRPQSRLPPLFAEVATGERQLSLGDEPKVGLIIFGFDIGQREHPIWMDHLNNLRKNIACVIAKGDAKEIKI
jgi:hypothetical protein